MADLASMGLAVDSSQIVAADKALVDFASAGRTAQQSADGVSAASARLNDKISMATKTQIAYNDNVKQLQSQSSNYWTETAAKVGLAAAAVYGVVEATKAADNAMSKASASAVGYFNAVLMYLPNKINEIWKEGIDKLTSYIKLSDDAGSLTTDFYQRILKGAVDAKGGVDQLLKSLQTMQESLAPKLGGSPGQNKLDDLTRAGNFRGNTGASALSVSTDDESRLKAMVSFWNQALDINQRLAALEVVRSIMGDATAKALEKDSFYLDDILKKTNAAKDTDIIKQSDIDRAVGLKIALDGAYKTISDIRTKNQETTPLVDWAKWGMEIQANWTSIVSTYAVALSWLDKIFSSTKKIAELKPDQSAWDRFFINFGQYFDSMTRAERMLEVAQLAAEKSLASQLQNPANVAKAFAATQAIADQLRGDDSFDPSKNLPDPGKTYLDAAKAIEQYVAQTKLATAAVTQSAGETKKAEVEAQLLTAAIATGLSPAATEATVRLSGLGDAAKEAADRLAGATSLKAAVDSYDTLVKSVESSNQQTQLEIKYHGQVAGALKEVTTYNKLYAKALDATGVVSEENEKKIRALAKAAGDGATQLEKLNKGPEANDQYDRAIITVKRHTDQLYADADALGLGAGALAKFRIEAQLTSAAEAANLPMNDKRIAQIKELGNDALDAANDFAKLKVASQIDFSNKTKFLSADDVAIANQLKDIYGNDVPRALASTEAAQLRVINLQKDMKSAFDDVGKAAFSSALQGKLGMDQLVGSLDAVAKKLSDKAFDNLLSGNPDQMVVGAIQAGASAVISLFTGDVKAKQELQKAQQAWAAMGMQITNFNVAAKGFTLGPLTNELQSLYSSSKQLQDAATKAKDAGGAQSAANAFNNAVERIWTEFKAGTQTLDPFQQSLKAVNDEAAGLKDTLNEIGFSSRAAQIDGIVQQQIDALTKQFNQTFITGLTARLNTATGKTFLNDAANLLVQHQQDLSQAGELGNDPTLLAQVAATFHAEAQKIVDDAGLVGTAFTDFTTQFPMLKDVVHEFTQSAVTDSKALQDAQNSAAKNITDYLNTLVAGPGSAQSPLQILASAQTLFQANLPLAQAGNVDAQNKFVSLADNLEKAARVVYASGQGYQDIRNQIINQGLSLPAVQATTDPVTQAVRDAIIAIQIGNAALHDANDNTTSLILPAVNAGNAVAVATNLASYFNNLNNAQINTTGALTGQVVPAVNAGNAAATAAALTGLFNQIDPSGKLATVVANTLAAANNTRDSTLNIADVSVKTGLAANNTRDTTLNVASSLNILNAIQTLQGTAATQLTLLKNALSPDTIVTGPTIGSGGFPTVANQSQTNNQLVAGINKIVWNTYAIAQNTALSVPSNPPSGQGHVGGVAWMGGLITGPGTGTSDSILMRLSNREFVIRNSALEKFGVGFFEQLNAGIMPHLIGNDNSSIRSFAAPNVISLRSSSSGQSDTTLLARIDKLTAEVSKLQEIIAGSSANVARAVADGTGKVADKLDDQTDKLASNDRNIARQRRVNGR